MNWTDILQWVAIGALTYASMGNTKSIRDLAAYIWRRRIEGDGK
jgi:hypothetical protein